MHVVMARAEISCSSVNGYFAVFCSSASPPSDKKHCYNKSVSNCLYFIVKRSLLDEDSSFAFIL